MKIEITNVGGDCIEMKIKGDGINTFYTMIPHESMTHIFEIKNGKIRGKSIKKEKKINA